MKCTEARRYLDPFLDGAIEVEANMKVLEHLNLCADCSRAFEGEKSLRGVLREKLAAKAPAALAGRISADLDAGATRSWRRWATAIAASLFVGLIALLMFSSPSPVSAATLAERAVSVHDARKPPGPCVCARKCCGEPLPEFYRKELGYKPCLHDFSGFEYETWYGSCWEAAPGKIVCWTSHRSKTGTVISHASVWGVNLRLEGGEKIRGARRFTVGRRVVLMFDLPGGIT